jgi:hypothetical protein
MQLNAHMQSDNIHKHITLQLCKDYTMLLYYMVPIHTVPSFNKTGLPILAVICRQPNNQYLPSKTHLERLLNTLAN